VVAEHLDRRIDGLRLAAVSARDIAGAEAAMAGFARPVPVLPLARLGDEADIVVECAPAALLRELAEPTLVCRKAGPDGRLRDAAAIQSRGAHCP
jgi:aspartate dehydrogenase